jgi:hypothetical protein
MSTAVKTSYTLQRLHNFTHRSVIPSPVGNRVSILPNIHFLRCTTRRLPQSLSQHFPTCKIFKLEFHHCGSHILQRPPLVPRLEDKPTPSPNSRKSHPILLPRTSAKLGKTCYSTKPTHISPMLCAVHMVTCSMNRSLGSQAGTTTNKWYITSTRAFPHHHQHPPAWIL